MPPGDTEKPSGREGDMYHVVLRYSSHLLVYELDRMSTCERETREKRDSPFPSFRVVFLGSNWFIEDENGLGLHSLVSFSRDILYLILLPVCAK